MCNPAERNFMLDHCSPNYERGIVNIQKAARKPFFVDAVQVTEDNIEEVARWCKGEIKETGAGDKFIKVGVQNPLNERQTKAFLKDWVLFANNTFKVYIDKAFGRSFDILESELEAGKVDPVPVDA